jgi:uncharacterized protein with HEPN domain
LDYQGFLQSRLIQDGVIRQFEIIGEATKHLSPETCSLAPAVPWKDMAGMRDKLIHQYFGVDISAVWESVLQDMPLVKKEVERILDRELAGFVETMRGLVAGTDAREHRNNDLFRRTISNRMAEVSVTLASLAEEAPRRRIVPVNPDCMNTARDPQPLALAEATAGRFPDPCPAV